MNVMLTSLISNANFLACIKSHFFVFTCSKNQFRVISELSEEQIKGVLFRKLCCNFFNGFVADDKAWPLNDIYDLDALVRFGSLCVYNALDATYPGKNRYKTGAKEIADLMDKSGCLDGIDLRTALSCCSDIRMKMGAHLDTKKNRFVYCNALDPTQQSDLKEILVENLESIALASFAIHFVAINFQWHKDPDRNGSSDTMGRPIYYAGEYVDCSEFRSAFAEYKVGTAKLLVHAKAVTCPNLPNDAAPEMTTSLHLLSVTEKLLQNIEILFPESCKWMPQRNPNEIQNPSAEPGTYLLAYEIAALVTYHQAKNLSRNFFKAKRIDPYKPTTPTEIALETYLSEQRNMYVHFETIKQMIYVIRLNPSDTECIVLVVHDNERVPLMFLPLIRDQLLPDRRKYCEK